MTGYQDVSAGHRSALHATSNDKNDPNVYRLLLDLHLIATSWSRTITELFALLRVSMGKVVELPRVDAKREWAEGALWHIHLWSAVTKITN
jgi:hypothetical protein